MHISRPCFVSALAAFLAVSGIGAGLAQQLNIPHQPLKQSGKPHQPLKPGKPPTQPLVIPPPFTALERAYIKYMLCLNEEDALKKAGKRLGKPCVDPRPPR